MQVSLCEQQVSLEWVSELRYKGLAGLARRHSKEEILTFEKEQEKELKENSLLVFVPEHLRRDYQSGSNFEFLRFAKPLHPLGSCFYFFLTKPERQEIMRHLAQNDELHTKFLLQYRDCFIPISRQDKLKTKTKTQTKTKTKITIREVTRDRNEEEDEEEEEKREAIRELRELRETRDRELMRKELMQDWLNARVELAVKEKENEHLRNQLESQETKINLVCQTMVQFLERQQQHQPSLLLQNTPMLSLLSPFQQQQQQQQQRHGKIRSVDEWIGPNLYNQKEIGPENRNNFGKWDFLFTSPEITPNVLYQYAISISLLPTPSKTSSLIRLGIKLTYEYPLKMILQVLGDNCFDDSTNKQRFVSLMQYCPTNYKVVLLATIWMDDSNTSFNDEANRINITTILLHCQLVLLVKELNRDGKGEDKDGEYLIRICKEQEPLLKPDFTLIDTYFPSFHSHGTHTYLSFNMGLNVVKKNPEPTGNGIGSNKSCAFCRVRARQVKNVSGGLQRAHQPKKCPLLAIIGNNEVTILMVIKDVLLKSDKKQSDALKNIKRFFGENDTDGVELNLNNTTLLRHATDEEITNGQHINGLRINKVAYAKLRSILIQSIRLQFQNEHFTEEIDSELKLAFSSVYVQGLDISHSSVNSLILDSRGESYFNANLSTFGKSTQRKSKSRSANGKKNNNEEMDQENDLMKKFANTDQLFFSFQEQYNPIYSDSIRNRFQFFNSEKEQQQIFLSNYIYPSIPMDYSLPPMPMDFSTMLPKNIDYSLIKF